LSRSVAPRRATGSFQKTGISSVMRKGQIIAAGVAAVFGLGSVGLLATYASRKPEVQIVPTQVNTTQVLVAKTQIELGQIVNRENFRWQEWPAGAVSGGYIKSNPGGKDPMQPLIGSVARAPILKDEPITPAKLVKPGDGGVLAAILPAGMRAISTKIREETAVGKLILPNDHVDVILIQRRRAARGGGEEFVSDTLFRNVRVLAIGQLIAAAEGKKGADGLTANFSRSQIPWAKFRSRFAQWPTCRRPTVRAPATASTASAAIPFVFCVTVSSRVLMA
jgi:pilus assembly protein CpaB